MNRVRIGAGSMHHLPVKVTCKRLRKGSAILAARGEASGTQLFAFCTVDGIDLTSQRYYCIVRTQLVLKYLRKLRGEREQYVYVKYLSIIRIELLNDKRELCF